MLNLRNTTLAIITAAATAALTSCASQVTEAERDQPVHTMQAATAHGGSDSGAAQMFLERSQETLEVADQQIADGDYEDARRTLQRAEAEAELALEYARLHTTQATVYDLKLKIDRFEERTAAELQGDLSQR